MRVMINPDVQSRLADKLIDGEELLWAETTNHDLQKSHRGLYRLTETRRRTLIAVWIFGVIGLIILFNIPSGIDDWGTARERLMFDLLAAVAMNAFVIPPVLLFQNMTVKGRVYKIGAYGLTNKRLFEFDHDLNIIRHLDASRLRHVYGFESVTLKPIGSKGKRSYSLGLMHNNVLTINYLHQKISKARQADS